MKRKSIIKDFIESSCEPFGGIKGASLFFGLSTLGTVVLIAHMARLEEKSDSEYGNITPENHLLDYPDEEDKKDIIGTLSPLSYSYYEDDRRVHARYSTTPEYQAIGYLISGIKGKFPNTCTAQISMLPGYEHINGKPIITTIDHCIPDNTDGAWMNFSARFMKDDGTIHKFTSPVDLSSIISFPDYNQNNLWSLFANKDRTESPAMAFLELNLPDNIQPFTIDTEWNGEMETSVIQVGNSSDRYGTTLDNQCQTTSHVSNVDYSVNATCHGSVGSSGGPLFEFDSPTNIIAITSLATAYAKRGDNLGTYVTFPSRDKFDYGSIPWLRKITP